LIKGEARDVGKVVGERIMDLRAKVDGGHVRDDGVSHARRTASKAIVHIGPIHGSVESHAGGLVRSKRTGCLEIILEIMVVLVINRPG